MKFVTLLFIIVYILEIFIIYASNNPENYNFKIFITLIVQAIGIYELKKSDDKIEKHENLIKKYNRLKYNYNLGKQHLHNK